MKKITLIVSIMFIWGCSQAQDQDQDQEAVKETVKEEVSNQVEAAKSAASDTTKKAVAEQVKAATQAAFQAGFHYNVIDPAYNTGTTDEVLVYEFFGYPCPHCATFEPYMNKLAAEMPENAKLVRIPVVFGKQWEPFAQAYYTFEAMDIVDQVHGPMFEAIHQHKKQFRTIEEIAVWVTSSFGVDKEKFLSTAKSFMVDGQVRKGMQMLQAMGVTSTPTLVTNGKFVPNNKALKTRNDIIEITQFLINQELKSL